MQYLQVNNQMADKLSIYFFIVAGLAGTVGALTYGLISFQRGHSRNQQNMMRLRVIAQGFTVISVVVGVAIMQWRKPEGKAT